MDSHADDHIEWPLAEHKHHGCEGGDGMPADGADGVTPPEIRGGWVDEIGEFEAHYEFTTYTTVRKFIGSPVLRDPSDIPPDEIEGELQNLLEILSSNGIGVRFGQRVSDSEMYRFITEELLDQRLDDVRIGGMTITFFYEEFHPDDKTDAALGAEDFLAALFNRSEPALIRTIGGYDGEASHCDREAGSRLRERCKLIIADFASFLRWEVNIATVEVNDGTAKVTAHVAWNGLRNGSLETAQGSGTCSLLLVRCEYAGWDVVEANLPDL